jgi:hypothetical protein
LHNPFIQPDEFDVHLQFQHEKFDEILKSIKPTFKNIKGDLSLEIKLDGCHNRSDIKLNNFAGTFVINILKDGKYYCPILSSNISSFTGNCGVKSIDHLYLCDQVDNKKLKTELLQILESLVFHRMNCGLLIGSDTNCDSHRGTTLRNIQLYGEGYEVDRPIWNPNYDWDKTHKISLFRKDLTGFDHTNYWD